MTTADARLTIRPPAWARAWVLLFLPVWLWVLLGQGTDGPPVLVWLVGAAGLALGARMLVMGAVGTGDGGLTVRNQFTTRTFRRDELADAVVDRTGWAAGTGWTVWLVLRDGSRHPVQLVQAPFRPGFTGTLERHAGEIRAWIQAPDRPLPYAEG